MNETIQSFEPFKHGKTSRFESRPQREIIRSCRKVPESGSGAGPINLSKGEKRRGMEKLEWSSPKTSQGSQVLCANMQTAFLIIMLLYLLTINI